MPLRIQAHMSDMRFLGRSLKGAVVLTSALTLFAQPGLAQTEPSAAPPAFYHAPAAAQSAPALPAPAAPAPAAPVDAPVPASAVPVAPSPAAPVAQAPAQTQAQTAAQTPAEAPAASPNGPVNGQGAQAPAPAASSAENAAAASSMFAPEVLPDLAQEDAPASTLPHDLSPWGMFMAADWVVKAVMIGLAFASVVTWTVWVGKSIELTMARRHVRRALHVLRMSETLEKAARLMPQGKGPAQAAVIAALDEWKASADLPAEGVKERVIVALNRIEASAGRRMIAGTGLLATIGATAPFVGLFGTVWGIMNSFIGISKAQTTNLAIVAPGIAEALLATAIGLVAAIPAVVIYNMFARSIAGYKANVSDCSAEVMRHLSRDLDREAQGSRPASLRAAAE